MCGRRALTGRDTWRVVAATLLVVATLAAVYLVYTLRGLLLVAFAALVLASALRAPIAYISTRLHLSHAAATVALYLGLTVALLAVLGAMVPAFAGDALSFLAHLQDLTPGWHRLAVDLHTFAGMRLGVTLPAPPTEAEVRIWVASLGMAIQGALPHFALRTGEALAQILFCCILSYYWLEGRGYLLDRVLRLLPAAQRPRLRSAYDEVERALGRYVGGQLALSLLLAGACLPVLLLLGLPQPLSLAFFLGLCHIVPVVGSLVGFAVPVMVAAGLSPARGLIAFVALLVVHQIENNLLAPRVLQRRVGLSPLLVLLSLSAGALLGGALGAVVAVPLAGALWIAARHALMPTEDRPVRPAASPGAAEREAL